MSDLTVYEGMQDMAITRPPNQVLQEAKKAAQALRDVVANKPKPVIMNGEQYLEFEDWQTVGKFYGVTAKVTHTEFIDYGDAKGFLAKAVAIRPDGMEVSAAEAMCLNDEPNWKIKPLFQLRSMAQTRACAKALRNVLAWVVVLAGYKPTPAEEIQGIAQNGSSKSQVQPPLQPPQAKSAQAQVEGEQIVEGFILDISNKSGKTNGKPWTLYGIFDGKNWYNTFDAKLHEAALIAQENGAKVKFSFSQGAKSKDLISLEIIPEEEPIQEPFE